MNRNLLLLFCGVVFVTTLASTHPFVVTHTQTVHDSLFFHDTIALRVDTVIKTVDVPATIACGFGLRPVLLVSLNDTQGVWRYRDGVEYASMVGPHLRVGDVLCLDANN